jgi:glucose/arabinose dehydrogenase
VAALAALPAPAGASIRLKRVAKLHEPLQLVRVPGSRHTLAVVERRGVIRLLRGGRVLRKPFLDISSRVDVGSGDTSGGHGGLLSVAFSPAYARSRRLYVFYTHRDGSLRVEEIRRASSRVVLSLPNRTRFDLGGQLAFGPDRLLYVGLGDQERPAAAQALGDLRGKLLRIDPRRAGASPYRIPHGNPFVGRPGARAEIWAYGLRNPFRFSFAPGGSAIVGDVGASRFEEIDVISPRRAGANLGWPAFEGRHRTAAPAVSGSVLPLVQHSHLRRYCSVIGGLVVRDRSLPIRGRYLYSDHCVGRLRSVRLGRRRARGDRAEAAEVAHPVGFGEDARRRVYVLTLGGAVYRVARR